LDVPAKLAARVRVYSRGHGRKTDKHDAVSIGLAAIDGTGILPVTRDDVMVSLRLLCDRREELVAQRTQAVCRLHRLLAELTPGSDTHTSSPSWHAPLRPGRTSVSSLSGEPEVILGKDATAVGAVGK
jgi:hypothetical protein